jgi:hypothetical protein
MPGTIQGMREAAEVMQGTTEGMQVATECM